MKSGAEYIVGGRPWQFLIAIRAVTTAGESSDICVVFVFCHVHINSPRFRRFHAGQTVASPGPTKWGLDNTEWDREGVPSPVGEATRGGSYAPSRKNPF